MHKDGRHPATLGEEFAEKKRPKADWWRHPYLNALWLIVAIALFVWFSTVIYRHPDHFFRFGRF
jgi:hypothetical protein